MGTDIGLLPAQRRKTNYTDSSWIPLFFRVSFSGHHSWPCFSFFSISYVYHKISKINRGIQVGEILYQRRGECCFFCFVFVKLFWELSVYIHDFVSAISFLRGPGPAKVALLSISGVSELELKATLKLKIDNYPEETSQKLILSHCHVTNFFSSLRVVGDWVFHFLILTALI